MIVYLGKFSIMIKPSVKRLLCAFFRFVYSIWQDLQIALTKWSIALFALNMYYQIDQIALSIT